MGRGRVGEGDSSVNGARERPRGVLHGDVRSEGSEMWEVDEVERRRSIMVAGLPLLNEEDRECVGVDEVEVIRGMCREGVTNEDRISYALLGRSDPLKVALRGDCGGDRGKVEEMDGDERCPSVDGSLIALGLSGTSVESMKIVKALGAGEIK
jgi:hypothetical protein